jgi:hypothetical protein
VGQSLPLKSTVTQLLKKFPVHWKSRACHRVHKSRHWSLLMSQINPVHKLPLTLISILILSLHLRKGPGSSVGIATDYELDGPGIESKWGEIFRTRPDRPWNPHPASCTMGTRSFPAVKRPGRGADHPPPPSAEVMKE